MVGSKFIDRAMGMITKGELARTTATLRQAHFGVVISGLLQLPHKHVGEDGVLQRDQLPQQPLTLLYPMNSVWITYRDTSIPHEGSPSLHLGPSIFMARQMYDGIVCGSICLQSQQGAPSCPPPLYQLPHMQSYNQIPLKCQSVWGTWVPIP